MPQSTMGTLVSTYLSMYILYMIILYDYVRACVCVSKVKKMSKRLCYTVPSYLILF